PDRHERRYVRADGIAITVQISSVPIMDEAGRFAGAANMAVDITERKQLEQQFLQAQKMEAVGRLAGGVAHDFNNLLTVMLGYASILEERLSPMDPLRPHVEELSKAGERARTLTRGLLAFSRHTPAQPKVLNVAQAVASLEPMLRRLLPENIDFTTRLGGGGEQVLADPGQLDQVVMNLVVNARDAMPTGGRLTVEVGREDLTEDYAQKHINVRPGRYVRIAVTDTGEGIPKEVLPHLFEPFFTTKVAGKGTGLGLSTVYGIVRNSGGHVWVYSEVGRGTTFKVYLPEKLGADAPAAAPQPGIANGGSETILLVEDDDSVRELVRLVLDESGYQVLAARGAADALACSHVHHGSIHLLLTDMVMPEGNGRDLAERLRSRRPHTKVIFMSGYTEDGALGAAVLPDGAHFNQKPILPDALRNRVRRTLDG
ncbi:MAG TPA: ATP-binding protein, partial [bacterium]